MSNPTVSIILPNRNYAPFLVDAINSIKAQTLTDWECIIIDDASTDNSVEVFKSLIIGDSRFKLISIPKPIGISAARNVGLDMATGEYISFLDSDDCYAEFFLETMVNLARKENADIAGATTKIVEKDFHFAPSGIKPSIENCTIYTKPLEMYQAPNNRKWIWIWLKIYKRSLLQDVRFRKEMKVNGDDVMFLLDLTWRVSRVAQLDVEAIYHRSHGNSITTQFNIERIRMFPILFRFVRDELLDKYDNEFWNWYYPGLFLLMLQECFIRHNDNKTKQDKKELRRILSRACKFVVTERLPSKKQRLLCRYLKWIR